MGGKRKLARGPDADDDDNFGVDGEPPPFSGALDLSLSLSPFPVTSSDTLCSMTSLRAVPCPSSDQGG